MPAGTSIPTEDRAAGAVAADAPIDDDVPCVACGYNLRGLTPQGSCPECGKPVRSTLAEIAARPYIPAPLWRSDPAWLTQLIEGTVLVLIAFGCMTLIAAAPYEFWKFRTRPREVLLGIACTAWVLSWFAAWKLGTLEPGVRPRERLWVRVWATLYLSTPFLFGLAPRDAGDVWVIVALGAFAAGFMACTTYYVTARDVAVRAGNRWLPIHAAVLGFLNAAVLIFGFFLQAHRGPDSLSLVVALHTIELGSTEAVRELARLRGGWPTPLAWLWYLLPVWAAAVHVWLLAMLIRARRRAVVEFESASAREARHA